MATSSTASSAVSSDSSSRTMVEVGSRALPLADFLRFCATGSPPRQDRDPPGAAELHRARELFVRAGLDALAAAPDVDRWCQIGVGPPAGAAPPELYRRVAELARQLLAGAADNVFFLHKPPGLRLRFQTADRAPDLRDGLHEQIAGWRDRGLVERIVPGVYEPESALFGGPLSMPYVHALFTVDSLTWLDFHAAPAPAEQASTAAWVVSLASLRTLFEGLDITGREDLGVWERVQTKGGRRLAPEVMAGEAYREVAAQVRAIWSQPDQALEQLPPAASAIVAAQREPLLTGATRWRDGYFHTRGALLGCRAAAANFVIFHWNRAGLPPAQQAVLAESLARQEV